MLDESVTKGMVDNPGGRGLNEGRLAVEDGVRCDDVKSATAFSPSADRKSRGENGVYISD